MRSNVNMLFEAHIVNMKHNLPQFHVILFITFTNIKWNYSSEFANLNI